MKFAFALLAITFAVAGAIELFSESEIDSHFLQFKQRFGRSYATLEEEQFRKGVFAYNLDFIFRHNAAFLAGSKGFSVEVNNFTDLTNTEFRGRFNGLRGESTVHADKIHGDGDIGFEALPATVDWTTKGLVTPIKNQEQCGSCWAFSAVASIEGQHALKTGKLVSLSEQNLVDCSAAEGNAGCEGGWMDQAFQYVIANKGIDTEASYPYEATDDQCVFKKASVGATIKSFVDVKTGSEAALQSAVAKVGPIAVAIDASQMSFQFYASGVYDEPNCSTDVLDHGVTAVGYGTLNGVTYWKVKNSWGTDWGQAGYIFMSRNKDNQCGISTKASYPVV